MGKFVLKRTLMLIPTLLIILTLVFALMRMVPGSPVYSLLDPEEITDKEIVEAMETEMGFNDPILVQYGRYLKDIVSGNWGQSYFNQKGVFENMVAVWEPTLIIAIYATIITVVLAIPVGILSATHRNSLLDYTVSSLSTATMCVPGFCLGLLLCWFFAYKLKLFPVVGYKTIEKTDFWTAIWNLTLPAFALGLNQVASLARYTRSCMLDVMNQDYIRTARAKGLSRSKVYYKHALKNTMAVVGTVIANSIAALLGGAAVTEKVFNIRGMGTLAVDSLGRRDYSQEQAIVLFFAMVTLVVNLLMDIFYKLMDPRIQYE